MLASIASFTFFSDIIASKSTMRKKSTFARMFFFSGEITLIITMKENNNARKELQMSLLLNYTCNNTTQQYSAKLHFKSTISQINEQVK